MGGPHNIGQSLFAASACFREHDEVVHVAILGHEIEVQVRRAIEVEGGVVIVPAKRPNLLQCSLQVSGLGTRDVLMRQMPFPICADEGDPSATQHSRNNHDVGDMNEFLQGLVHRTDIVPAHLARDQRDELSVMAIYLDRLLVDFEVYETFSEIPILLDEVLNRRFVIVDNSRRRKKGGAATQLNHAFHDLGQVLVVAVGTIIATIFALANEFTGMENHVREAVVVASLRQRSDLSDLVAPENAHGRCSDGNDHVDLLLVPHFPDELFRLGLIGRIQVHRSEVCFVQDDDQLIFQVLVRIQASFELLHGWLIAKTQHECAAADKLIRTFFVLAQVVRRRDRLLSVIASAAVEFLDPLFALDIICSVTSEKDQNSLVGVFSLDSRREFEHRSQLAALDLPWQEDVRPSPDLDSVDRLLLKRDLFDGLCSLLVAPLIHLYASISSPEEFFDSPFPRS